MKIAKNNLNEIELKRNTMKTNEPIQIDFKKEIRYIKAITGQTLKGWCKEKGFSHGYASMVLYNQYLPNSKGRAREIREAVLSDYRRLKEQEKNQP